MKRDISKPTSAILILNTVANTAGATTAGGLAAEYYGDAYVGIFSGILTLGILFLSEILPKTYGAVRWQGLWPLIVWPLSAIEKALTPFVWVTHKFAGLFLPASRRGMDTTEEEIQAMIRIAAESGALTRTELELLSAVFEFDEIVSRQVMVPWREVATMHTRWDLEQCLDRVRRDRHTRYPLINDQGEAIGLVHVTDLVGWDPEKPFDLNEISRPIRDVPETMPLSRLLREMQASRRQMAVVVDEFGNTVGILTLENVLEQIVGSVRDEFDEEEPEIVSEEEDVYLVNGRAPVERVNEKLDLDLEELDEVDTFSGWVVARLGRLPKVGDEVENDQAQFEVTEVVNNRARHIRVRMHPEVSLDGGQRGRHRRRFKAVGTHVRPIRQQVVRG